jgi:hypothetical protein
MNEKRFERKWEAPIIWFSGLEETIAVAVDFCFPRAITPIEKITLE